MRNQRFIAGLTAAGVFCISLGIPQRADATAFIAATEPTQILNNIALLEGYIQQGQQYLTQINQYERQIKDGTIIGTQLFGPVATDLIGLQHVVQGGSALAYNMANLDQQFTAKFAGFGYHPSQNFTINYKNWQKTSLDTTQHALGAANLQSSQLGSEQALLNQLTSMSQSSDGQLKAVQVGNQVAAEQIDQLMKLRQLMMADMQSKGAFQAAQTQIAASAAADATGFFQLQGGNSGMGPASAGTQTAAPAAAVAPMTPR